MSDDDKESAEKLDYRFGPGGKWGGLYEDIITGELIYLSVRRRKAHFTRMVRGWGIQSNVVKDVGKLGCTRIILIVYNEDGGRDTLSIPYSDFVGKAKEMDLGEGLQYFLPENDWYKGPLRMIGMKQQRNLNSFDEKEGNRIK